MREKILVVVQFIVWLLPASKVKNAWLRALGHPVDSDATARTNVVWRVRLVALERGSRLGRWNIVKNVGALCLGEDASIGRLNVLSAHPVFTRLLSDGGTLVLAHHAKITSRHQIDCSGGVTIGAFASVAGHQTRIMSHSVDLTRNAQAAHPVRIGERSFVGTRALILGGAWLPDRSVLAAGSVLVKSKGTPEPGLWGGVPASHRGAVSGRWFDRSATSTRDVWIPGTDTIIRDAL